MNTTNPLPNNSENNAEPDQAATAATANAATAANATTPAPASERGRTRPRTGPIIWGALVLAFCLYIAQRSLAPDAVDGVTWLIAGVTGLGALLLAVGVVVLVRNGTSK